jgi:ophiobolin F synthase
MFIHSIPIDPAEVRKTGSFTTLPVRIHRQNDLADAANHKLLKDWDRYIGDGQEKKTFGSLCELGNLCSLVCPEVEPERLRVLAYGVELGFIHDGGCINPSI